MKFLVMLTDSNGSISYVETAEGPSRPGFTYTRAYAAKYPTIAAAAGTLARYLDGQYLEIAGNETVEIVPVTD